MVQQLQDVVLGFVAAELKLEYAARDAEAAKIAAANRTARRLTAVSTGLPMTRHAVETMRTVADRGSVIAVVGDTVETASAVLYGLVAASRASQKTVFFRQRPSLVGRDYEAISEGKGQLAVLPALTWRDSVLSAAALRKLFTAQLKRINGATCDCLAIESPISLMQLGDAHRDLRNFREACARFKSLADENDLMVAASFGLASPPPQSAAEVYGALSAHLRHNQTVAYFSAERVDDVVNLRLHYPDSAEIADVATVAASWYESPQLYL